MSFYFLPENTLKLLSVSRATDIIFLAASIVTLALVELAGVGGLSLIAINLIAETKSPLNISYNTIVLIAIFIIFARTFLGIWLNYYLVKFAYQCRRNWLRNILSNYKNLEFQTFDRQERKPIFILQEVTRQLCELWLLPGLRMLLDATILIALLGFLAFNNVQITLVLMVFFSGILFLYTACFKSYLLQLGKEANDTNAIFLTGISNMISNVIQIKLLNKYDNIFSIIEGQFALHADRVILRQLVSIATRYAFEFLGLVLIIVGLVSVKIFDLSEEVLTSLIFAMVSSARAIPLINNVSRCWGQIVIQGNSKNMVTSELKLELEPSFYVDTEVNVIECVDVRHSYINSPKSIYAKICRGDIVAVRGPSGVGKSTLMKIMLNILYPSSGKVLINGNEQNKNTIHNDFGYCEPNANIFTGTIAENVTFFQEQNLNKELREIFRIVDLNLKDFKNEEPTDWSGGEKQKLNLARLLYSKKSFLFLDETFANIDHNSITKILDNFRNLGKTVVFVSHDRRVSDLADKVISFNE